MSKQLDIYLRYRNLIAGGTLLPGDRLPSMRRIAESGGYGINTVRSALALLERDGLVEPHERSGVFVQELRRFEAPTPPPDSYLQWNRDSGERLDHLLERIVKRDRGFAVAAPGVDLLPVGKLEKLFASLSDDWIGYAETQGDEELRRRISLQYEPVNGFTSIDRIMITNGATEAISIVIGTLVAPGDIVVVESPTYYDYFRQLSAVGAVVIEIRTTLERGMDLGALAEVLSTRKVRMVIVQPNVQNPTGATMPDTEKKSLMRLLKASGCILVQDDVYGDLSFGAERPANLSLFEDYGKLVLISSISKSLAPGLRIGWIIASELMERLLETKVRSSLCSSRPSQMVLAKYLSTPAYPAHLRKIRAALSQRLDEYMRVLTEALPEGSEVSRPSGGCLLWVSFPREVDATEVFLQAAQEGVVAAPGELFSAHPHFRNFFRINAGRALLPPCRKELLRICAIVHRPGKARSRTTKRST
ncbi:MAG TPA: PLP-dependent aminotransferase family protein [Spirochaetia bacterium]|nr:PLP-dependent aminotransferase family protein [Spirochaetia bacterium]